MRRGKPTTPALITASRRRANNVLQKMTTAVSDAQFYNFADQVRAEITYLSLEKVNRPQFANQLRVKLLQLIQQRRQARGVPPGQRPPPPRPVPAPQPVPTPDRGPSPMRRSELREMERMRAQLKECQDQMARMQAEYNARLKQEREANARLREQLAQIRTQEGANEQLVQENEKFLAANKRLSERLQKCLDEKYQLQQQLNQAQNDLAQERQENARLDAKISAINVAYEKLKGMIVGEFPMHLERVISQISGTFPHDVGTYEDFLQMGRDQFKLYQEGIDKLRENTKSLIKFYERLTERAQSINDQFFPRKENGASRKGKEKISEEEEEPF